MRLIKGAVLILFFVTVSLMSSAQDFMLQGWYWDYPASYGILSYAKHLQAQVPDFKEAGFDYIWLPPLSAAVGGGTNMGYDVRDYYDLGEYAGATRFGTRTDVNNIIRTLNTAGIHPVADIICNQRAGGAPEVNPAVKGWIENFSSTSLSNGDNPYPSDRFQAYILLGGSTGNDTGYYYVKIRSASQNSTYYGYPYTCAMWTNRVPLSVDSSNDSWEYEPNDGGECGDTSNFFILGTRKYAHIDNGGCGIDEFRIHMDTTMFNRAGDTLFITITNDNTSGLSGFSDQYVHNIYYSGVDSNLYNQIQYETMTDFTHMPSGKGAMNWTNFKPNGNPTTLNGDWDEMLFDYDLDQVYSTSTQTVLEDYAEWMFDSVHIGGMRLDAVKNFTYAYTSQIINYLNQNGNNPGMIVGEYYDFYPPNLLTFINNVNNGLTPSALDSVNMRVFDFGLRGGSNSVNGGPGGLYAACETYGYDARQIFTSGMVNYGGGSSGSSGGGGGNPKNVVTFVNNHDFRDPGQPIITNPELAYAFILTNNFLGIPCVFYSDYYQNNFMRGRIKGMMHANQRWINGSAWIENLSAVGDPHTQSFVSGANTTTVIYQQHNPTTGEDVIVAINFSGDTLDVYQQVNTNVSVAVGDTFTDIFGAGLPPILTAITPNQELHVILPPRSFTVYVQGNHIDSLISLGDTLAPVTPPDTTTGIKPIQATNDFAKIFPNPFSSMIMVAMILPQDESVSAQVTDVSGRVIFTDEGMTQSGKLILNPSINNPGIYFLKLSTTERSQTFKIVKE
jgi:alpha-amylase